MAAPLHRAKHRVADQREIFRLIVDPAIRDNPYNFCKVVFPWGVEDTPLHAILEPRTWQRDFFEAVADHIRSNRIRLSLGLPPVVFRSATVSGRGPGKTALQAMILWWFFSTRLGGSAVVAANTEDQLRTTTFPELSKWKAMALNRAWGDLEGLSLRPSPWLSRELGEDLKIDPEYYYCRGQLWNENNPDAFAGKHSMIGMLVDFEEASGIADAIWRVADPGFFTELTIDRYFFAWGNGRRMEGKFYRLFNDDDEGKDWRLRSIDSRTVEGLDHAALQAVVDLDPDSYDSRVEVKGLFPKDDAQKLIPMSLIHDAMVRPLPDLISVRALSIHNPDPLVLGCDIARAEGGDDTVLWPRQGRDARTIPPIVLNGFDNVQVAAAIIKFISLYDPDAIFIDAGGGAGVIDVLKHKGFGMLVHEVNFAGKVRPENFARLEDKRTEMYVDARSWLATGYLPDDKVLRRQLNAGNQEETDRGRIKLESKRHMREVRGITESPDRADGFVLTFAAKVAARGRRSFKSLAIPGHVDPFSYTAKGADYDVFS